MISSPFGQNTNQRSKAKLLDKEIPAYRIYLHSPAHDAIEVDDARTKVKHMRVQTIETDEGRKSYTRSLNFTEKQYKMYSNGIDKLADTANGERLVACISMSELNTEQSEKMHPDKYLESGLDRQDDKVALAL